MGWVEIKARVERRVNIGGRGGVYSWKEGRERAFVRSGRVKTRVP